MVSVRQLQHLVQVRERSDPVWDCVGDSPDGSIEKFSEALLFKGGGEVNIYQANELLFILKVKTERYSLKTPLMNHKSLLCVACIQAWNGLIVAPRGPRGKKPTTPAVLNNC